MKLITFLMPSVQLVPSGGYKIVYEYANRLAKDGYRVVILHPSVCSFWKSSLYGKLKSIYYMLRFNLFSTFKITWFDFEDNVENRFVFTLNNRFIPTSDIIIATGAQTVFSLHKCTKVKGISKFYFIQGYETWAVGKMKLLETYRLPLKKIVIADYLVDKVKEVGESATLVYNGFDFDFFKRSVPIDKRDKYTIVMPYNKVKLKGCDVGFEALKQVHEKYPQLKVLLYGVSAPVELPDYCTFYLRPDKEQFNFIYNSASIFLGPSFSEGFCLTVAEAMQCGCAVVCTNIGGYTVICKDKQTALVGEVGNPSSLASLILLLIEDNNMRFHIANSAYDMIQSFTWDKAYSNFKNALNIK